MRLRSALHRRGFRFRKNVRPVSAVRCRADIVFASAQLAIFVDGCFWHGCPEHGVRPRTNSDYWDAKLAANVERDRLNDDQLAALGWQVIRVWEHEPFELAAERVSRALLSRVEAAHGKG
jgi:DNA mismatch endonuclease (patch repair protein)